MKDNLAFLNLTHALSITLIYYFVYYNKNIYIFTEYMFSNTVIKYNKLFDSHVIWIIPRMAIA